MKTNHKETSSYASAITPLLKHVNTRSLALAMFVAVALLGTIRGNEPKRTESATVQAQGGELRQGSLEVYSATDEFNDGGSIYYAHSSYAIYAPDGKLFKNVENHISHSDEIPEIVPLPVGSYTIVARSGQEGYVRVRIVIKGGQRTILDLDPKKETPRRFAHNGWVTNPPKVLLRTA